jgi:polysaccharide export outer membrane protein
MTLRHIPLLLVLAAASAGALAQNQPAPADPGRSFSGTAREIDLVIGPHDVLDIQVFGMPELTRKVRVSPDGTVSLPLLGDVGIAGLSPQQAEDAIAAHLRAKDLLVNPQVTIFISDYVSRQVSVQGAVAKPGPYVMLGQKTLLDMIGEAGGLNDRAGKRIFVLRPFQTGGDERIQIDAEELIYEANPSSNIILQPGDIISVPYERTVRIYVNGAVQNPGEIEFPADEDITVLQAVTSAGGVTDRANERKVRVIRRFEDGTKQIIKVNLKKIRKGKAEDLLLEPDDIVDVPESFF